MRFTGVIDILLKHIGKGDPHVDRVYIILPDICLAKEQFGLAFLIKYFIFDPEIFDPAFEVS